MPERDPGNESTTEHDNARRIRALFAAFRQGDLGVIEATIAEDAVWHFPGRRGKLAGDHVGRDAILRFLLSVPELTGGTFHLELIDVVANERNAVVLFRGSGRREDGRVLDNPTCLRVRMHEGRAAELWEFVWDLDHVEAFWA
jgi:ketosteroid isomerase-like protein